MPNNNDDTEKSEAMPKVIHSAELEAEMEDRWDDGMIRGIREGARQRREQEAAEARKLNDKK